MNLSDKAQRICQENYAKNCGGCPLRKACVQRVGAGYESFYRWIDEVNQCAEEVKAG